MILISFFKNKRKTSSSGKFHAGRTHHNEIITFEYLHVCQILDVATLLGVWGDAGRRWRPGKESE